MILKLYDCLIKRKGKAAKGTIAVKTFGIPVLNTDKVAKAFDYATVVLGHKFSEVLDAVQRVTDVSEQVLAIALLQGLDIINKSETAKTSNIASLIANRIYAAGLALDKANALAIGKEWVEYINKIVTDGFVDNFEAGFALQMKKRKEVIDNLTAQGLWKVITPRLVKKDKPADEVVATPETTEPTPEDLAAIEADSPQEDATDIDIDIDDEEVVDDDTDSDSDESESEVSPE